MSKISYLHLKFKTSEKFSPGQLSSTYSGWKSLRAFGLLWMIFGLSCSHLRTPDYKSPGDGYQSRTGEFQESEFTSPDEYFNSQEVKEFHRPIVRGAFNLVWPIANPVVNRGFKIAGRRSHRGIDFRGKKNDPILAAHDGIVVYAGSKFRGYGKMVIIEYDNNWASLYAHLNRINVVMGDEVKAGQTIGKMGRTGRATGVHLHFELLKQKQPIDPYPMLKSYSLERSISGQ